jgi:hypothetical protein
MSSLGIAAQLIGSQGPRRFDQRWISRAVSSLPVPVSPVSSTGTTVRAACATFWSTALAAALSAISPGVSGAGGAGTASSARRRARRSAAPASVAAITA